MLVLLSTLLCCSFWVLFVVSLAVAATATAGLILIVLSVAATTQVNAILAVLCLQLIASDWCCSSLSCLLSFFPVPSLSHSLSYVLFSLFGSLVFCCCH